MSNAELVLFHGMPAVRWRSLDGACAIATLQGAHVVSWMPAGGEECLFLSERSAFEAGRAIRGGIPVIFPQFADRGPLAQHGFARVQAWRFVGVTQSRECVEATFALENSASTEALWPHAFRLELAVAIGGPRLEVGLRVVDTGAAAFSFTAALHTYLRVADSRHAKLEGLRGVRYLTRGESDTQAEPRELVTAVEPIDRIYFSPPLALRLRDNARVVRIAQAGFTDTVVWNPGRERASQMPDMAAESFLRMLCVEAAAIDPPVALGAGEAWSATQSLELEA